MKNPFERFFTPKQITPEQAEQSVRRMMAQELKMGVDFHGIRNAFRVATELNERKKFGLTRNHVLNLLREQALIFRKAGVDDFMFGSREEHVALIDNEIENIRREEQDKPQSTQEE